MQDALQVTKVLADNCRSKGTAFRLGVHVPFLLGIPLVCVADGIWHPVMKRPCISRLNFIWFHPFNFVCLCRLYSRMSLLSFSQMIFTLDAMEEFVVRLIFYKNSIPYKICASFGILFLTSNLVLPF